MYDILKDKTIYNKIILVSIPFMAVCSTALTSLIAAIVLSLTVLLSAVCVNLLKAFFNSKTAPFAHLVISVGVVGVIVAVFELFAKDILSDIGFYLPVAAIGGMVLADSDFALNNTLALTALGSAITVGTSAVFLLLCGIIRELLGFGSVFGIDIYTRWFSPAEFFKTPAGGLLIAAVLTMAYGYFAGKSGKKEASE